MELFKLTRALVDIESITGHEEQVGLFLIDKLSALAARHGGRVERIEVEPHRFNVFAHWGEPMVTLSTHIDTVPPFFPSSEDDEYIWGRGACDTKGIIASMITAAEALLAQGVRNFGLLFVVGEERNSAGALADGARTAAARASSSTASRPRTSWRSARKARCVTRSWPRQDGALGLSRAGRVGHRQAAGRAGGYPRRCRCRSTRCSGRAR